MEKQFCIETVKSGRRHIFWFFYFCQLQLLFWVHQK